MARAYASTMIAAPVEAVWAIVRDFAALPSWLPGLGPCTIEDERASDAIGCVRHFTFGGNVVRERLLELDDCRYRFGYNFETPAFPVRNYHATFELIPATSAERTFARWSSTFDEAGGDEGKYEAIISRDVFAGGLASLAGMAAGRAAPEGAVRWGGMRRAKVFCASAIAAPLAGVWAAARAFDGMGGWHPGVVDMHMLDGAAPDQVSGVRDFTINGSHVVERMTWLSDVDHACRYVIERSPMPWLNYHAGVRFYPVTSDDTTFGVWTADWVAPPQDDLALIPGIHQDVFQTAFDTLATVARTR